MWYKNWQHKCGIWNNKSLWSCIYNLKNSGTNWFLLNFINSHFKKKLQPRILNFFSNPHSNYVLKETTSQTKRKLQIVQDTQLCTTNLFINFWTISTSSSLTIIKSKHTLIKELLYFNHSLAVLYRCANTWNCLVLLSNALI